ncbi:condensin complex subunit 2/barren [Phakopsora pachyrhizi]|uniref:Condensin complex subunit 2 n=1 Tax=Phakopsora pachyrhizi TaxID=170000 RepID=A0AAV0BNX0_PHAPC|nr:condensin complex subunit 2/barren [Phakopsora pachyrhizi]CAH7687255.1 condensin complex subunit 2/barren [Phakopsora pachyrhizi]
MVFKRTKSDRPKVTTESPASVASSSTSSDSDSRRTFKKSKKIVRHDRLSSSSEDENDDADWEGQAESKRSTMAENAKRRLSGKYGTIRKSTGVLDQHPLDTPSPNKTQGRVGALARARENQAKARQSIAGGLVTENPLLISTEVMNNNYDEWMKMATDNKINVNNTWSFALIDYFHDMSLLRNPDSEGGINFQKASCTLDGCVKIWTSRVDSVATETGKLLSGLAEEANNIADQLDEENDEDLGEDSAIKAPKKSRTRVANNSNSLVDFNEKIKVKELELEFTVDPLFKKTCADFDEGGPGGILMSLLSIDSSMTIVFDASGKPFTRNPGEENGSTLKEAEEDDNESQQLIDVTKLKAKYLGGLDDFQNRLICPSLSNFKFSTSDSIQTFVDLNAFSNAPQEPFPTADGNNGFGGGNDGDGGDFFDSNRSPEIGGGDFGMADNDDGDDEGADLVESFNPNNLPTENDLLMALVDDSCKNGEQANGSFGNDNTGMFDYFDKSLKKSWAGPEHWKLRRTVAFRSRDEETQTTMSRVRREKPAFSFDFSKPTEMNRKAIFQTSSTSLTLAGYKPPKPKSQRRMIKKITGSKTNIGTKQMQEQHCLPDDMHFNASQLLRFETKPKNTFNMRVKGPGLVTQNPGPEIDENYWARTAAAAAAAAQASTEEDAANEPDSANPIPFATQFFQDEGDDLADFEEEFDNPVGLSVNVDDGDDTIKPGDVKMEGVDENDLIAATQNINVRTRPDFINYAKKAKRVDVKKLKENIWKELEVLTNDLEEESVEPSFFIPCLAFVKSGTSKPESSIAKTNAKKFTKVIGGLRSMYPKEKMEEISTSFCFICLLHLANEKGLRIQPGQTIEEIDKSTGSEELIESKYVGNLEELNIVKESLVSSLNK